jgi:hypothetical protein
MMFQLGFCEKSVLDLSGHSQRSDEVREILRNGNTDVRPDRHFERIQDRSLELRARTGQVSAV